ncbi:hypothetical protein Tco_0387382 [Tanacetum coccineum]
MLSPPPITNKPFTKPPTEQQLLAFIKRLGYDEDPKEIMTTIPTFVATRLHQPWRAILSVLNRCIVHSANLDYASLIWDEFEWQAVDRMSRTIKQSNAEMHNEGQDSPISKLINTVDAKFKFRMKIPDIMINDAIKQSAGYKFYRMKKDESKKEGYAAERELKLKGVATEDPAVQSLLALRKASKESRHFDMDISDNDDKRDDDDAAGFGVFVYNKSQELLKFTPFSLVVTCSSMEDFTNLLNDTPKKELTDLLSKPVFTDA